MNTLKILMVCFVLSSCASSVLPPKKLDSCNPLKHSSWQWSLLLYSTTFDKWTAEGRTADRVFFGDSIVQYWNLNPENFGGYDWMTDANPKTNVVNTGIYGDNICTLILRMRQHVTNFKPKFVFVDGGGNDLVQMVSITSIQESIMVYAQELRNQNPDAKIVYGAIPPTRIPYGNQNKKLLNGISNAMMQQIGNACFIDLYDVISKDGTEGSPIRDRYSYDSMHFTPDVYPLYKERVEQAFKGISGPGIWCYK